MRTEIYALHHAMLEDVCQILEGYGEVVEAVDLAFHCARDYWEKARLILEMDPWLCESHELFFFKKGKPLFTGMMEYFALRFQAQLLLPRRQDLRGQFWRDEQRQISKFRRENAAFCEYFALGETHWDRSWFVHMQRRPERMQHPRIYNQHPDFSCEKDWEAAMFTGFALYEEFIQSQLLTATCLTPLYLS